MSSLTLSPRVTAMAQQLPPPSSQASDTIIAVWPEEKMPGQGASKPEAENMDPQTNVQYVTEVSHPTLALFKAPATNGPAPAVVICPGGGYEVLSFNKEGTEIAVWLNSIGITGIVLKYRVPKNRDGALQDIARAMRVVRSHAPEWNIDPKRVGVLGFSAGGHLVVRLSCNYDVAAYSAIDDADKMSCRPDFVIPVYPAYLEVDRKVPADLPISTKIPPTLIVHNDDDCAFVPSSMVYDAALTAAQVPHKFLYYPTGGHGYGLRCKQAAAAWPHETEAWLREIGILG